MFDVAFDRLLTEKERAYRYRTPAQHWHYLSYFERGCQCLGALSRFCLPSCIALDRHTFLVQIGRVRSRKRHVVVCFNISTSASLYGKRAWEERSEFMISLAIARCISLPQPMGRFRAKPDTLVGTREQFMWPFYFVRSSNRFRSPKTSCNTWSSGRKKLEWSEHKND